MTPASVSPALAPLPLVDTREHLLGLAGPAGSGKDTAADYLCQHYGFVRYAFAEPIREMLEALFAGCGVDHAYLYEPALKERIIPELGISARALMQTLGTEWGRDQCHPDLWVRQAQRRLGLSPGPPRAPVHDRIVITDCRFVNEAIWLRAQGGRLLRLHRDAPLPVRAHVSEAAAARLEGVIDVPNHGTTPAAMYDELDAVMQLLDIGRRAAVRCQDCGPE